MFLPFIKLKIIQAFINSIRRFIWKIYFYLEIAVYYKYLPVFSSFNPDNYKIIIEIS